MLPRCRYLVLGSELHIEIDDHQQPENERKGSAENQRTAAGVCLQDSLRVLLNQRARPLVHSTFPSSPSPFSVIIVCWLRSFVVTGERHVYKSCIDQGPGCKIQPRACRLAAVRYKSGGAPPRPRPRPAQPPPRSPPPLLVSSPNPPIDSAPPQVTSIPFAAATAPSCFSLPISSLPSWLGCRFLVRVSATSPESPVTGWIASLPRLLAGTGGHASRCCVLHRRRRTGENAGFRRAGVSSKTFRAWVAWEMAALLP